ncbi:hypothetical protein [Bacillus sp. ISL-55]|uniref:hypothetical protein n=1 Tax=Bacillus sp. ISL-55 TaxID=2819134 RepID=UPI001BEA6914|nr:hypothetical protein [Bacillus sp. ISL-55]MBT2692748.1 hypothetical protein [Bacillus sp. ISL-55]
MRKWAWLLLLVVLIAAASVAVILKPDQADFASWMEETYDVQCLDERCGAFHIGEGGEKVLLQSMQGGYSPGIFQMTVHEAYRNLDNPSYYLELEVAGFLGKITIKEEKVKRINKR